MVWRSSWGDAQWQTRIEESIPSVAFTAGSRITRTDFSQERKVPSDGRNNKKRAKEELWW